MFALLPGGSAAALSRDVAAPRARRLSLHQSVETAACVGRHLAERGPPGPRRRVADSLPLAGPWSWSGAASPAPTSRSMGAPSTITTACSACRVRIRSKRIIFALIPERGGCDGSPRPAPAADADAGSKIRPVDPGALSALRHRWSPRPGAVRPQQMEAADCGAACLAMVLAHHGKSIALDEVRAAAGTNRGTDALSIVRAAEQFGLRGRGVMLRSPTCTCRRVDPALGLQPLRRPRSRAARRRRHRRPGVRRQVPFDRFRRHFTGVALVFQTANFVATPPGRKGLALPRPADRRAVAGGPGAFTSVALRVLALALPVLTAMVVDRVVPRGDHSLLLWSAPASARCSPSSCCRR